MEKEIIAILQTGTIEDLCFLTGIETFQAKKLIEEYRTIEQYEVQMVGLDTNNLLKQKWEIINGLVNGDYLNSEKQSNDYKNIIISALQSKNVSDLCGLTGIDEETAKKYIEQYNTIEQYEVQMVGLDTSNLLKQKWEIINGLSENFKSETGIKK